MNATLRFLLSAAYPGGLASAHLADLRKSGLSDRTIALHRICSCPPDLRPLLGFQQRDVRSAYLIPFPDPRGGWMDHVKVRVFGADQARELRGDEIEEHRERWRYNGGARKYLVRRASAPRLYFLIPTMRDVFEDNEPLWIVEGMKKSLAASQLGLPAISIESAWSWHVKRSTSLLPDFDSIRLAGRVVELVPDSDVSTNPAIARSMRQLADALRARGARPRLVRLPSAGIGKVGMDDFITNIVGPHECARHRECLAARGTATVAARDQREQSPAERQEQ